MAVGKKSFKLYTDLIDFVNGSKKHDVEIEPMTDEEAGMLFRWILEYVNDKHPIVPKPIKYIVAIIKRQLDDELESWKEQCITNKENGLKGGRPRKPKETEENRIGFQETDNNPEKPDKDKDKDIYNNDLSISKDISKSSGEVSQEKPTPLITLPCIGNYQHPIFDEDIKHYKELYPAVDILQQFKNMVGWLEANPQNRKTKNGVKSFIARWLSKCQDKAPKVESSNYNSGFNNIDDSYELDEEFKQKPNETYEEYKKRVVDKFRKGNDPTASFGGVEKL